MIKKNEFWSEYQVAWNIHFLHIHFLITAWFWNWREANLKKISHISGCTPARTLGWKVSSTLNLWISFKYQYFGDFMQYKMSIKAYFDSPYQIELKHIFVELEDHEKSHFPLSNLKILCWKSILLTKMIKKNEFWSEYQVAEKKLKHPFSSHTFPYNWFWKCREANLKKISHISGCTPVGNLGWKVSSTLNV